MKIAVCMKQIPSDPDVKLNEHGSLIRSSSSWMIGKEDYSALEAALRLKDENKEIEVEAVTMGGASASAMLYEALGKGADHATLITDESYRESDSLGTALVLSAVLETFLSCDLIFLGVRSMDAANGSLSGQLSGIMGIHEVVNAMEIKSEGKRVKTISLLDHDLIETLLPMPCIVSFHKEAYHARLTNMRLLSKAYAEDRIGVLGQKELKLSLERIGWKGASAQVIGSIVPQIIRRKGQRFTGTVESAVNDMLEELLKNPIFNMEVLT